MTDTYLYNPIDSQFEQLVVKISGAHSYVDAFTPFSVEINGQKQEATVTLPLFYFTKPEQPYRGRTKIIA